MTTKTKKRRSTMPAFAVSFAATPEERDIIHKIAARWEKELPSKRDRLSMIMDINAYHSNGCALRLQELLDADQFNFAHDVIGIAAHLDRRTGKLMRRFLPRFARPKSN